jgi:hypothetical protein
MRNRVPTLRCHRWTGHDRPDHRMSADLKWIFVIVTHGGSLPRPLVMSCGERERAATGHVLSSWRVCRPVSLDNQNATFRPIRQWARNKLNRHPDGVAKLAPAAVGELADFIGCTHNETAPPRMRAVAARVARVATSSSGRRVPLRKPSESSVA